MKSANSSGSAATPVSERAPRMKTGVHGFGRFAGAPRVSHVRFPSPRRVFPFDLGREVPAATPPAHDERRCWPRSAGRAARGRGPARVGRGARPRPADHGHPHHYPRPSSGSPHDGSRSERREETFPCHLRSLAAERGMKPSLPRWPSTSAESCGARASGRSRTEKAISPSCSQRIRGDTGAGVIGSTA